MAKQSGWYYTTEGRLRYRDDDGWTEYYLDFEDIRNLPWPPPAPMTMHDQVLARRAAEAALRGHPSWWRRKLRRT